MARKTKLMLRVEKEFDQPLERLLPELVNDQGLTATADTLGVSKATLGYWMLKMGINVKRVALALVKSWRSSAPTNRNHVAERA